MTNYYSKNLAKGLSEEKRIKTFFYNMGFKIYNASYEEDKFEDIDFWLGDVSISVKAQHSALKYKDVSFGFELEQQLRSDKTWEKSWFYTGKAQKYLILQGSTLYLIDKATLVEHLEERAKTPELEKTRGFMRICALTDKVKTALQAVNGYRYDDSRCGYIPVAQTPLEKVWTLPPAVYIEDKAAA